MDDEERFNIYYKLPNVILEMMNWLCSTKFYKKTYLERRKDFEEVKEAWKFCDFTVLIGTIEKPEVIKIGEIPNYKGDHEKSIVVDIKSMDNCYLVRGYATGLYASKVIQNIYPIPKYMKEKLIEFIKNIERSE